MSFCDMYVSTVYCMCMVCVPVRVDKSFFVSHCGVCQQCIECCPIVYRQPDVQVDISNVTNCTFTVYSKH